MDCPYSERRFLGITLCLKGIFLVSHPKKKKKKGKTTTAVHHINMQLYLVEKTNFSATEIKEVSEG